MWRQFGGLPEFYSIPQGYTVDKREGYPLRPGIYQTRRLDLKMHRFSMGSKCEDTIHIFGLLTEFLKRYNHLNKYMIGL